MRAIRTAVSALLAAALLVSYGHAGEHIGEHIGEHVDDANADRHAAHGTAHGDNAADPAAGDLGLALDGESKWPMDEHTRSVLARMADSFVALDHASMAASERKSAGVGLQALIGELVQGCTMTGAAHDQLHLFLVGYIPAVTALSEGGRLEDAERVARYLGEYEDYFE